MKRHSYLLVAIVALVLVTSLNVKTQPAAQTDKSTGSVSGRVIVDGKGQAGVEIDLIRLEQIGAKPLKQLTLQDGSFSFANLAPATYQFQFNSDEFRPALDDPLPTTVIVSAGKAATGITFVMVRGLVITGRVIDAEGKPLAGRGMRIFQSAHGRLLQVPAMGGQTDTNGRFRVTGLRPGRYLVAERVLQGSTSSANSGCAQAFYPGVSDPNLATVVEVSEAVQIPPIEIQLGPTSTCFSASGTVLDLDGSLRTTKTTFKVQKTVNGRASDPNPQVLTSNEKGEFVVKGLMPGHYILSTINSIQANIYADPIEFDIVDQNISDLSIRLSEGATLSGSIFTEGAAADASFVERFGPLKLVANVRPDAKGQTGVATANINSDGTFRLSGLSSGLAFINLMTNVPGGTQEFTIVRIERDGVAQPRGIHIDSGEQITDLKIVVTTGAATIRGVVKFVNGALSLKSVAQISLISAEDQKGIKAAQVDVEGHFLLQHVPVGQYLIVLNVMEPTDTPGVFKPHQMQQPIEIVDGTDRDVTIEFDFSAH